jgi:hypothetical protein
LRARPELEIAPAGDLEKPALVAATGLTIGQRGRAHTSPNLGQHGAGVH